MRKKAKVAEAVNRVCHAELIADDAIEARNLETQARFAAERSITKAKDGASPVGSREQAVEGGGGGQCTRAPFLRVYASGIGKGSSFVQFYRL